MKRFTVVTSCRVRGVRCLESEVKREAEELTSGSYSEEASSVCYVLSDLYSLLFGGLGSTGPQLKTRVCVEGLKGMLGHILLVTNVPSVSLDLLVLPNYNLIVVMPVNTGHAKRTSLFAPIELPPIPKKSILVVQEIAKKIQSGELKPGERLPSERELASMLGVSRPSIREAFAALQAVGLLETRLGEGTYVATNMSKPFKGLLSRAKSLLAGSESPAEILLVRRVLEVGAARLAIRNATPEDDQIISKIWEKKKRCALEQRFEEYLDIAEDFHLALARASGSRMVVELLAKVLKTIHQPLWRTMRIVYYQQDPNHINEMLEIHARIVEAFLRRDKEGLTSALEDHFDLQIQQLYGSEALKRGKK